MKISIVTLNSNDFYTTFLKPLRKLRQFNYRSNQCAKITKENHPENLSLDQYTFKGQGQIKVF